MRIDDCGYKGPIESEKKEAGGDNDNVTSLLANVIINPGMLLNFGTRILNFKCC